MSALRRLGAHRFRGKIASELCGNHRSRGRPFSGAARNFDHCESDHAFVERHDVVTADFGRDDGPLGCGGRINASQWTARWAILIVLIAFSAEMVHKTVSGVDLPAAERCTTTTKLRAMAKDRSCQWNQNL